MTEMDNKQLVLNLLVVGIFFFNIVHIYNLNNFQDDLVDEFMNPKPGSGSGPAASSSAKTGSKSEIQFKPMQKMLIELFNPLPTSSCMKKYPLFVLLMPNTWLFKR